MLNAPGAGATGQGLNCLGFLYVSQNHPWSQWFSDIHNYVSDLSKYLHTDSSGVHMIGVDPFVDVKACGAVGDGATDDTNAIDLAFSGGNRTVFFPSGTYLVDADHMFEIKSNTYVLLNENAVIVTDPLSASTLAIFKIDGKSNIVISGGTLRGNRTAPAAGAGYGISLDNSAHDLTFDNVKFENFYLDGIMADACYDVNIRNCKFDSVRRNGISVVEGYNIDIINCTFTNADGAAPECGIDLEPTPVTADVYNIKIIGNTFRDNDGKAIQVSEGCSDITISSNYCEDNGNGIYVVNSERAIVTGNTIVDGLDIGINIYNSHNCTVSDNICRNHTNDGIYVGTPNYVQVGNNKCYLNGRDGINVDGATNGVFSNNVCYSNDRYGIRLRAANYCNVLGNTCYANSQDADDTYDNIRLNLDCTSSVVQSNICLRGSGANQPKYGINIDDNGNNDNIIANNDMRLGGRTAGYNDIGTGTLTADNWT